MRFAFSTRLRAAVCSGGGEERPRREPAEKKEPVVVDVCRLRLPEHREHGEIHEHQRDRKRERPGKTEDRALVLRAELAPEEAPEQLVVAQQVRVDAHRAIVGRVSVAPLLARGSAGTAVSLTW